MEEKNATKISLSTFFLILAIIAIIVMGIFIYKLNNDKTAEIQKSTELQAQVDSLNGTVSDLQGKINNISETINTNSVDKENTTTNTNSTNNVIAENKNEANYDIEISMSELENVNYSNNTQLKNLKDKYKGKTVKITGYVSNFGDDDLEPRKNLYQYR